MIMDRRLTGPLSVVVLCMYGVCCGCAIGALEAVAKGDSDIAAVGLLGVCPAFIVLWTRLT
jgi:hypothetical protein